ncbi:hypothetical protein LY76DRAFT_591485 [Colletotrichum caudatum]|nr:hypothetical protein LY76DRAFT_591485 [Colletotrichum caudatum]
MPTACDRRIVSALASSGPVQQASVTSCSRFELYVVRGTLLMLTCQARMTKPKNGHPWTITSLAFAEDC